MTAGMLGLCAGVYGLLDHTAPRLLGLPAILIGAALCSAGLTIGGRRVTRTQYRPDPWLLEEWIVAGCGVACAALLLVGSVHHAAQVNPSFYPLRFPSLPVLPAVAILLGALAGFVAPPPPTRRPPRQTAARIAPAADRAETRTQVTV
jgi:energy-coupling factor transport system permease protein